MIDQSKIVMKTARYGIAASGGISDLVLLDVARQYETTVLNKASAIVPDQLAAKFTGSAPVLITEKVDGQGAFVYYEAERSPQEIFLFQWPSGRTRVGLACLDTLAAHLKGMGVKKCLLRVELYVKRGDGPRKTPADVTRNSFSTNPLDHDDFRLALLDLVMLDGKDWQQEPMANIWAELEKLGGGGEQCRRVMGHVGVANDVAAQFAEIIAAGGEGVVVRRLDRVEITKIKPRITLDAVVIGYVEGETEDGAPCMASLLLAMAYPDGSLQALCRVGSGFTDETRREWLQVLQPQSVAEPIAMTDSSGRVIQFVPPKIVVEAEAEDLVMDAEHRAQVFSYGPSHWSFLGTAKSPRPLFAVFKRRRDDKEFKGASISMTQLGITTDSPTLLGGQSEPLQVVRREVYVKESKGDRMVRKLVVGERPTSETAFRFAVYWTDFSAGRKDPLKVSVSYAETEERAQELAASYLAEGITKGFNRLDA
jgi:hypothetical protein